MQEAGWDFYSAGHILVQAWGFILSECWPRQQSARKTAEFYRSLLYIHYEKFFQRQVSSESGLVGACLGHPDYIMARVHSW